MQIFPFDLIIICHKQISEAFKRFGISDGNSSVLVVLVNSKHESQHLAEITSKVDGRQIPAEELSSLSDLEKIRKVVHICCNV